MARPWLSVLIPTYNGEPYLRTALESVARQADRNLEIIAVDDGSTDGTCAILEAYQRRLPVRVVTGPHRGNWVVNANRALGLARGIYICFLHQDDVWTPDRLQTLRCLAYGAPDASLLLQPAFIIGPNGGRLGIWRCPLPSRTGGLPSRYVIQRLLVQNFIAMPAPAFPRKAALGVGGLDERLWYTADWDLWLKLAAAGPTAYLPRPTTEFRIHPGSQTILRSRSGDLSAQIHRALIPHLDAYCEADRSDRRTRRVALFSAELNASLADYFGGVGSAPWPLIPRFIRLGPRGWHQFLRDSRIFDRVIPRLRAGFRAADGRYAAGDGSPTRGGLNTARRSA